MNRRMQEPMQQQAADGAAIATGAIAATTWIAELNAVLQLGVTAVALVAGAAAAWYHIEGARKRRRERLNATKPDRSKARDGG